MVPFVPNAAQQYYWERRRLRNIIIKARQKGLSKIIDADQLIDCMLKPTNAVVISHEKTATQRLFKAVRAYIESMEVPPSVSIDSKSEIHFDKTDSSYIVGTAGQRAFGRGDTLHRVHMSEAAFYEDFERIFTGVSEAAEYGQIDIETTPNGRDAVYDMYQKAKKGLNSYTPIFIPWFIDAEYSVENMTEKEKAGMSDSVQEMFALPDADFLHTLDEKEKDIVKRVEAEHGIRLTVGQLKWRRYKIWDRGVLFFQEYPEDDVSCFLQSGRSVFSHIKTDPTIRIPLDDLNKMSKADKERLLGNKEKGIRKKRLYGGLDPSEGTVGGDPQAFAVIEPGTKGEKSKVIFELSSNDPVDIFAEKVAIICRTFRISLGIEKGGVGLAMVKKFEAMSIPFEEWSTTATTRPMMLTELEEAYRKEDLIESYPEAEDEARNMVYNEKNRPDHPQGKHDDRVFARAIALQMAKAPVPGFDVL